MGTRPEAASRRRPSGQRELSGAGIGFALVSSLGFSTLGIFATSLYGYGFSVPQTLAWRFTLASALLWCALGIRKIVRAKAGAGEGGSAAGKESESGKRAKKKAIGNLLLLAFLGFSPQAGMYFLTVKLLAPGITSLLLYLYPAFVLLFSALFFKNRPSKGQLAALAMSFIGCAITFFEPGSYPLAGLILGVLVAVAYGGYLVWSERVLAGVDSLFSTAVIMTVAGLVYWAVALVAGLPLKAPSSPEEWLVVAGIAVLATALPITTLFAAMEKTGAANVSLVSTVEPAITVLLSAFFLGEELTANRIWGGLFIVGGVVALRVFSGKRP
jgi:drug/metabolite transporter (DMT)-like permease